MRESSATDAVIFSGRSLSQLQLQLQLSTFFKPSPARQIFVRRLILRRRDPRKFTKEHIVVDDAFFVLRRFLNNSLLRILCLYDRVSFSHFHRVSDPAWCYHLRKTLPWRGPQICFKGNEAVAPVGLRQRTGSAVEDLMEFFFIE